MKINKSKGVIRIYYNTWGNANIRNKTWQADYPNGDVMDYNTKEHLKEDAEKEGYDWQVERWHRDGTMTIMETNKNDTKSR